MVGPFISPCSSPGWVALPLPEIGPGCETGGDMSAPKVRDAVQLSMDLAKLGGLKDIMPTEDLYSTQFKPVPTKP